MNNELVQWISLFLQTMEIMLSVIVMLTLLLLVFLEQERRPSSIYLALINGLSVANYPLVDLELESQELPKSLQQFKNKLFGLTITPKRLQEIREKRRSTGKYASPHQVQAEIRYSESLFNKYSIPYIDTTSISVEEIATSIRTQLFNNAV